MWQGVCIVLECAWQGDIHGGDMCGRWARMAGGVHGKEGIHGRGMHGRGMHCRGHVWQGAFVPGVVCTKGACMAGGCA